MTLSAKLLALIGWTRHRCAVCGQRVTADNLSFANVRGEPRVVHTHCDRPIPN